MKMLWKCSKSEIKTLCGYNNIRYSYEQSL